MTRERYKNLDYLRGLMAFSIMLFHYYDSCYRAPLSDSILGRLGVYGVSIFYVLSGLTLFLVYKTTPKLSLKFILVFWIKRIFRIFPILWITIIATLLLTEKTPSLWRLFLNFTGLFGFIAPGNYVAKGQWSIGNELVFYSFFPILLFLSKKNFKVFLSVVIITLLLGCYFAFYRMHPPATLHHYWKQYINPFNQLMFFTAGIMIGALYQEGYFKKIEKFAGWGLLLSIMVFVLFPVHSGDKIYLVTGYTRFVFFFISCGICMFVFLNKRLLPTLLDNSLSKLGEATYSLYLLHPIVFIIVEKSGITYLNISMTGVLIVSMILSVMVSYFTYIFLEKKFVNYGKIVSDKVK